MKTKVITATSIILLALAVTVVFLNRSTELKAPVAHSMEPEKGCVFMTTFGEQSSEGYAIFKSDAAIITAIDKGLDWLSQSQQPNGGWGAGLHSMQHQMDPHSVKTDPATTAMVAMAILRSGSTLKDGQYSSSLNKALNYLLLAVESTSKDDPYITTNRGTQIQSKLGEHIDAVLTMQFFSNLLNHELNDDKKRRIERALDICVSKVQMATDDQGKVKNAGWAGVLQSGFATNALESAEAVGANVDKKILEKQRAYQKGNVDEQTGDVKTSDGAGIMLYSVSSSVRATAKEAREAEEQLNKAKEEGIIAVEEIVTPQALERIGFDADKAKKYSASYGVYNAAKEQAQRDDVMTGFGNNGGEEFLSYLQTGESLLVNKDNDWKTWYDKISGRIVKIQNKDGSWNGHHCITSPVFCTATSLMILTVENDIDWLTKLGENTKI
ncbi:hypothetical protein ACFQ1M_02005 [Sungkyunkwania multivorans]|uniref:Alpha-macroglobulin-like TED domain-containing protein n=1 Tax=Sungkyunkwania multivorans TaxID=1173618 RepID=A0ABW3CUR9_9FLAO